MMGFPQVTQRVALGLAGALALFGTTLTGSTPLAEAITRPVAFFPAPGSTIAGAPRTIRVQVSERFELGRSFIRVTGSTGEPVLGEALRLERTVDRLPGWVMARDVTLSNSGLYTVDWQAVDPIDEEIVRGRFQFRVVIAGQPEPPSFRSTLPATFGQPRAPRAARFPNVASYHAERNLSNAERAILARNLPAAHRQLTFAINTALEADDTEILAEAYRLRAFVRASQGNLAGAQEDAYEAAVRGSYEAFFLQYPDGEDPNPFEGDEEEGEGA